MPKKKTSKTDSAPAVDRAAPCSDLERVIAALLTPTIEAMRQAGIARIGIERDKSILLQMDSAEVIGPINAHAAFERVFP